jgi:integrase
MKPYRVYVLRFRDCRNLVLRYQDPVTGKYERSTTYTDPQTGEMFTTGENRKQAKKLAARWEADLNAGRAQGRYDTSWAEFRERYEDEVVPSLAESTAGKISSTLNAVERILPKVKNGKLGDLNAEAISRFQAAFRNNARSESTIASYLSHVRAALAWAVEQGMIREVPKVKRPNRAKNGGRGKSKGRAITGEEFDRMLAAILPALLGWRKLQRQQRWKTNRRAGKSEHTMRTDERPQAIAPAAATSWNHFLKGLWLSGLRLSESLELFWDRHDRLCIDLEGKRPMLRIPAELEKGNRDRLLPITPDFAEFLLATDPAERRGPVFRPLLPSGSRANAAKAGRMISLVGELAGVKVHTHPKTGKVKFASAHDLRRSFGNRWARRVTTAVLQKLMRHASITTTMSYYVDLDAAELAEHLWGVGSVLGIVAASGPVPAAQETTQPFTE